MKCCGFKITTRFCPHCGEAKREPHPLDDLLAYLLKNEKTNLTRASEGKPHIKDGCLESAAKWKKWADLLQKAIHPTELPK